MMTTPLCADDMLIPDRPYLDNTGQDDAAERNQISLRKVVPAFSHCVRDRSEDDCGFVEDPVLDPRFCGFDVSAAEQQIELALLRAE